MLSRLSPPRYPGVKGPGVAGVAAAADAGNASRSL